MNLSRLLIKIQQRFVEPVMTQARQLLRRSPEAGTGTGTAGGAAGASAAPSPLAGISLRVTDYAGPLMGFFSGSKDEVAGLGSMIGLDTTGVKGLGLKSGRFDAQITAEDGKIDINCGSGLVSDKNKQMIVYRLLSGLMYSRRFDRLFSEADATGQFVTRPEVARALIDWADGDDQMFPAEGASGAEDYRYDARADRYRAHDSSYDTIEEIKLVRGVSESFMEAFAPHLTVYASDPDLQGERRRHHQQERRRLHAAADGAGARRGDVRSVEAAQRPGDPGRHAACTRSPAWRATARPAPASTACRRSPT